MTDVTERGLRRAAAGVALALLALLAACGGGSSGGSAAPAPLALDGAIRALDCADAAHCVGVGDHGNVIVTRDGGRQWRVVAPPTDEALGPVAMASTEIVYAATASRRVLRSTDGGLSWTTRGTLPADPTARSTSITRLWAFDADGLVAELTTAVQTTQGERGFARDQLSIDGGGSWRAVDPLVEATGPAGVLWAYHDGLQSRDRGTTWQAFTTAVVDREFDRAIAPTSATFRDPARPAAIDLWRTEFDSAGSAPHLQRYLSADGGLAFASTRVTVPVIGDRSRVAQVAVYPGNVAYAVVGRPVLGTNVIFTVDSLLLRSGDGGLTWSTIGALPCDAAVFDAEFVAIPSPPSAGGSCFPSPAYALIDLARGIPTAIPGRDSGLLDGYPMRLGSGPLMKNSNGHLSTTPDRGLTWLPVPGT